MRKVFLSALTMVIAILAFAQEADMVIRNANVYTVNPAQVKADAVGVKDGKIIFVGAMITRESFRGSRKRTASAVRNGGWTCPSTT